MPGPICIRVTDEERRVFQEAAESRHKTLTDFIKDAATEAAKKPIKQQRESHAHTGLPTYIRASIYHARRGGAVSYREVGWNLAIHLNGEIPASASFDDWQDELDALGDLLFPAHKRDAAKVLAWFDSHYPRIMNEIPRRRRSQFLEGVYDAADEEKIEFSK